MTNQVENKTIKLYSSLDVLTRLQNLGAKWVLMMNGTPEELRLTHNGLFNLHGTDGELIHPNHDNRTEAWVWTTPERMYCFFYNNHFMKWSSPKHADIHAKMMVEKLKSLHERYHVFEEKDCNPETHSIGVQDSEKNLDAA